MHKPSNAMLDARQTLLVLCALLLVLSACRADGDRSTRRGMMAPLDTTRLQEIYRGMEQDYGRLMAQYEEMRAQMSSDVQAMYQHMQQMYGEANAMHQQMMQGGMMHEEGMMGRGAGMMGMMGAREWDQQMLGMHEGLAQMHGRAGRNEMAQMHEQMTQWYRQALEATPADSAAGEGASAEGPAPPEGEAISGAELFVQQCATCHGAQGQGMSGAFPPLAGSEWVAGDEETPIRVVLHGLQGSVQVGGTTYNGVMPAFGSRLSDAEIAAILTHIRSSWGNEAPEVTADEVQEVRREYSGRTRSWSASDFR